MPHAAFIDDTADHGSISSNDKALSMIEGRTLEAYLFDWITRSTDTFCVDVSGRGTPLRGTGASWGACPR